MKQFAELFLELGMSAKTGEKIAALERYFASAPDGDRLWALSLLMGRTPKRRMTARMLREWAAVCAGLPQWLFDEGCRQVGDLAEAVSLMLPPPSTVQEHSLSYWMLYLKQFDRYDDAQKYEYVRAAWDQLGQSERLVFTRLLTGDFRPDVSRSLLVRALVNLHGVDAHALEHRLAEAWMPEEIGYAVLISVDAVLGRQARPYPPASVARFDGEPEELGDLSEWLAEWKWDGIRCQCIMRGGRLFLWTKDEELVNDRFPELHILRDLLPDGAVLDGELLPYRDGQALPFHTLQTRMGKKTLTPQLLRSTPVALMVYDILERDGVDMRSHPLERRREALADITAFVDRSDLLVLSPALSVDTWNELAAEHDRARELGCGGILLKRRSAPYPEGSRTGDWWAWNVEPLTIDAVLLYAQKGTGRYAELFAEFTVAVWDGDVLIPVARVSGGLSDDELQEVDAYIRANTVEKFGPVRTVRPEIVFGIAFEGIRRSTRHKSGVMLRSPRILHRRYDTTAGEAGTLAHVHALLASAAE